MANHTEIDFLLTLEPSGVVVQEGDDADVENIREWLATPMGEVYGRPTWGHPLNQYRHLPHSTATARAIENSLLIKLAEDLPELPISRILVEPVGKDGYYIGIATPKAVIVINEKAI